MGVIFVPLRCDKLRDINIYSRQGRLLRGRVGGAGEWGRCGVSVWLKKEQSALGCLSFKKLSLCPIFLCPISVSFKIDFIFGGLACLNYVIISLASIRDMDFCL